jgi:hypothetical protein
VTPPEDEEFSSGIPIGTTAVRLLDMKEAEVITMAYGARPSDPRVHPVDRSGS